MRPVYRSGFPGRLISPRRHNLVSFSGLSASLYPPSPLSGRGCAHFTPLKVYSHPVSTFPTPLPCASISAKDTTARKQINAPSESPSSTHNLTTKKRARKAANKSRNPALRSNAHCLLPPNNRLTPPNHSLLPPNNRLVPANNKHLGQK